MMNSNQQCVIFCYHSKLGIEYTQPNLNAKINLIENPNFPRKYFHFQLVFFHKQKVYIYINPMSSAYSTNL